jgi:PadR family transcriptional regulator, regulatory protein PadR
MDTIQGDRLRGHLETMVLAVLERGEGHGLEIIRRLEETGFGLLRLKEGSLYPALYRLEEAGKIQGAWDDQPRGQRGARRRIYRLTSKGKRELTKGRAEWASFVRVIGAVMGASA